MHDTSRGQVAETVAAMSDESNQELRGKVGQLSEGEMEEFLSSNVFCRLGVLDDDGWPYVVPV